jgi:predicted phage terminase large subunit-like protein
MPINLVETLANRVKASYNKLTRKQIGMLEWGKKYVPHYFTREFSHFHIELANKLDALTFDRDQKTCVIAPRGYAKSTISTFLKVLKSVCEGTEKYILIGSNTEDLAAKYLASIKEELEGNALLRQDYPQACQQGSVWNSSRIETGNDVCVETFGKGSGVRGRKFKQFRPSLIILDDPQETDDVISPTIRKNDIEWLNRSLIPCGDRGTNIFIIGNNLHTESMVADCSKKPDWDTISFAAIEQWPTNMELWDHWEQLYLSCYTKDEKEGCQNYYLINKEMMDVGAIVLWPEKESLYDLMVMRASLGHAAFDAEKQNNPRDPSKCEFDESWFQGDDVWYTQLPTEKHSIVVGYNDPSKGKQGRKRDYSPIITLHFYPELKRCFVECDIRKIPVTELTDSILRWHRQVQYHAFGIESNGFQEMIGDELIAKAAEKNIVMPVYGIENYGVNKNVRISRLSVWLNRRFFVFKKACPYTRLLIEQLLNHPFSEHDDGSDALEGALRLLTMVSGLDNSIEPHEIADDGLGDNLCGL